MSLATLTKVVEDSRIWEGERAKTHKFILSPSVYRISPEERQELELLGYAINDCLLGISRIAHLAFDKSLNYSGVWATVRRILSIGIPSHYTSFLGMGRDEIPRLLKVDIMVDESGRFRIAEIDGHNKHGMGYSTIGRLFHRALYPEAETLPGTIKSLSDVLISMGHESVKLLYGNQERFYDAEFRVAAEEFAKYGIDCIILPELEVRMSDLEDGVFIDLPLLNERPELYNVITTSYLKGKIKFIIPPKPYFGAKTLLGMIRNDAKDPLLEGLLTTFMRPHSLARLREYIPDTLLVGKNAASADDILIRASERGQVLKRSIASGMKGVIFSDNPHFREYVYQAARENLNWVVQEEVRGLTHSFTWYEGTEDDYVLLRSDDWQVRLTAHYIARKLADITVTARRDKSVHGAKDSLQLGVIVD